MVGEGSTVLVVADEATRRERYERWLDDDGVVTVADADAALDRLGPAVDVVVVDRESETPSSLAVARRLAASADDVTLLLAGATGLDLGDEPVDDVLPAPVDEADLGAAIEAARTRRSYAAALREFYAYSVAAASIEADACGDSLADDEGYRRLRWLAAEKRVAADAALERTAPDWASAFDSLPGGADDASGFPPVPPAGP